MKKLFTFIVASFLMTTVLSATTYNVDIAGGTSATTINTAVSTAVTAGNTDITIRIAAGGTIGSSGTGVTITIPAAVTNLKITTYGTGAMPIFYTAGLFTISTAGTISNITLDGVNFICYGTSKNLLALSSTAYSLGVTIQNCYIQGFKYVLTGGTVANALSNGIVINNNIFKSGSFLIGSFTASPTNTVTISNNTIIEYSGGNYNILEFSAPLSSTRTLTFKNNTIYNASTPNVGVYGIARLASDPGNPNTGTFNFSNNLIVNGTANSTYAKGNYGSYPNLSYVGSVTVNITTFSSNPLINATAYTGSVSTLMPNAANGDFTIGDSNFAGRMSVGDPRWYYPVSVTLGNTSLSGFSYNVGSGPSSSQSFTISALALRSAVTLTAPPHYEISSDGTNYFSSLSLGGTGLDLVSTTISVRLIASLPIGTYNAENISVASTGVTTQNVSCSGSVLSGRSLLSTPTGLNISNITGSGFTASWNAVTNASSYTVQVYQGATPMPNPVTGLTGTTTDITGLTSGNTYTYTVTAVGDGVTYDNSPESSASTPVRLLGSYLTDPFKTKANGNWSDTSTWQSSPDGGTTWIDATLVPDANATSVTISNDVTYAGTPASVGNVTVNSGSTLTNTTTAIAVVSGKTLTIASGATFDNQIDNATISAGSGTIQVNGTYKYSVSTSGGILAFTNVTFASGSTLYIGGTGAPRLAATNAGSVVWASTAGGSFLNSNPTTIAGNFTITSALASALNHGTGNSVRTLTVGGNLIINGGAYNPQGGNGTGTQTLTVNGNVYLSGAGKLYAANPTVTGLGTISVNGNIYIQSPTAVAIGAGASSGSLSLAGTSPQTISTDTPTGYAADGLTFANAAGVSISSNIIIPDITINSGSILNVSPGKQLTVSTTLTNNGTLNLLSDGTNGTATILTPATISGSGTTTVQQYLPSGRNWYISSPVASAATSIVTGSSSLWSYAESTVSWVTTDVSFIPTKGYVANMASSGLVTFTGGALNNGDMTSPSLTNTGTSETGYNLVGNPYPSYVNAMTAINNAGSSVIDPTIWYRTQASGTYNFETVNTTSGIGTNNAGTGTVTGYIPPMQAFWVHVASMPASLTFSNSMRAHAGNVLLADGITTVPTTPLKAPSVQNTAQQLLRLQVSNGTNSDEAIVYSNTNASNGFDNYDSQKMSNNNAAIPEIYTTVGNEKLVINGMNSITPDTEIPVGFTTGQSNAFSITATEISNFDASTKVYLKDNLLNTEQDLTDGTAYTFTSDVASTTSRFSVVFKSVGVTTGVQAASVNSSTLIYKNANNQIAVNCNGAISDNASISVYNALGQKLELKKITGTTTVIDRTFNPGVYVVSVTNGGISTTRKVILN
jgi:hypothetical protein